MIVFILVSHPLRGVFEILENNAIMIPESHYSQHFVIVNAF